MTQAAMNLPDYSVVLRELRGQAALSQRLWADQIVAAGGRCSLSTVQAWENRRRPPNDRDTFEAIVQVSRRNGCLKMYVSGPLAGQTVTAEALRDLLVAASKDPGSRRATTIEKSVWWRRRPVIGVGTAFLGLLAVMVLAGWTLLGRPNCSLQSARIPYSAPRSDLSAEFQYPRACATDLPAGELFTASGYVRGDLSGVDLWLAVVPQNGQIYPQSPSACDGLSARLQGSQWTTKLQLSKSGRSAEQFDLVVGVAPDGGETSRRFRLWFQDGCEHAEEFGNGLETMPSDFVELSAITVRTRG